MMDLERIKTLEKEIAELKNLEKQHKSMNGKLYDEVDKLKEENDMLKKENEVIREGNDYLGVYSQTLCDEVKKLADDMTGAVRDGSALVKKNHRNILFITAIQGFIRYTQRLEQIYKKLAKPN